MLKSLRIAVASVLIFSSTALAQPTFDYTNPPLAVTTDGTNIYYPWKVYFNSADIYNYSTGTVVNTNSASMSNVFLRLDCANDPLTGELSMLPDQDKTAIFGKAKVGYMGFADVAGFSHYDMATTTGFSLAQDSAGATFLNSFTGQNLNFLIGGQTAAYFDSSKFFNLFSDASVTSPAIKWYRNALFPDNGFNTLWWLYIPPSSTDLRWFNGADLLTLDTSGNLAAVGAVSGSVVNVTSGNLYFPTTTGANNGVISQNFSPFISTYGSRNIFIGNGSGNFNIGGGADNTALGVGVMPLLSSTAAVVNNVGIGNYALQSLQTGSNNFAFGYQALGCLQTQSGNTAIGTFALFSCSSLQNTGIGLSTAYYGTDITGWVLLGRHAGTNSNGVALGVNGVKTSDYGTFLGYQSGYGVPDNGSLNYCIALGANATVASANVCVIGRPTDTTGEDDLGLGVETTAFTSEGVTGTAKLYVEQGNGAANDSVMVLRKKNNVVARAPRMLFLKAGANEATPVADTQNIGQIFFGGYDGIDYNLSAGIAAVVDGTVSANVVPMGLSFKTSTGNSASPGLIERMWIDPTGFTRTTGRCRKVNTQTTNYTLAATDEVLVCNAATAFTVYLAGATGSGQTYAIKNIGSASVTLTGNSTDTIDGSNSVTIIQWDCLQVVDYASNSWVII